MFNQPELGIPYHARGWVAFDTMITLAVAAGATQGIRLMTSARLGPLCSAAVLTKEAATLDARTGGRLTLGPGVDVVLLRLQQRDVPHLDRVEAELYGDFVSHFFRAWKPTVREALRGIVTSRQLAGLEGDVGRPAGRCLDCALPRHAGASCNIAGTGVGRTGTAGVPAGGAAEGAPHAKRTPADPER